MGAVILVLLIAAAVLAPVISPFDALELRYDRILQPPGSVHWFGTDDLGRDIFSRILHGGAETLRVSLAATLLGVMGGLCFGIISGYFGGWIDDLIQRVVEVFLAFPTVLLLIAIIAVLGRGLEVILIAGAIATIPIYTRLLRGITLSVRHQDYIVSAQSLGAGHGHILLHHVLPNVLPFALTYATLGLGSIILATAGLSYIGLGAQPPSPEWGAMLNAGRPHIRSAWWMSVFPGLFIFLAVLSVNLVGERLRVLLDPRNR
ncbi:MAG: ABC transporter permease [Anaerolineae bacterium]|nr:ABC transporter permease [Anaerolineae bacterium]